MIPFPYQAAGAGRVGAAAGGGGGGSGYDSEVLADSPLAYFKLDETTGGTGTAVVDGSGNSRDCSVTFSSGSATLADVSTVAAGGLSGIGRSMNFRNALTGGGTVSVRDDTPATALRMTTGAMTFEFWWVRSVAAFQWLLFNGLTNGSGNCYYEMRQNTGGTAFELKGSGASVHFTTNAHGITGSAMTHIVLVVNAGRTSMELFVDKVSKGSTAVSGTFTQAGTDALHLGERPDQTVRSHLNNIAIYNSALSSTRIAAHYDARDTP